ncbi:MAG: ATP-binding protein [Pseudomonadota bacterium]
METKIRISGNHINELSENIPSNIFALNELIKNSYDACASYCEIVVSKETDQIIIKDNGKGFDPTGINELFHLSRSSKKFGKIQKCGSTNRRVQGSKGLGFLAAFRFGHYVCWDTNNAGKKFSFGADKKALTELDDISSYEIEIEELKSIEVGTSITIDSNKDIISSLLNYFANKSNYLKLVGAFSDDDFEIILKLPGKVRRTTDIPELKDININDQMLYVKYSSDSGCLYFYRDGYLERQVYKELSSDHYEIDLELMIYNLESYGRKKISPYFYKPNESAITPLLFINKNLFNNYSIFDADIFRSRRSNYALPQMIGYINIYSESESFQFNSDRTNFVENDVTDTLLSDIESLNELVQENGSELKSEAKKAGGKLTGPAFPKQGNSVNKKPLVRANIELQKKYIRLEIPSQQVNLSNYISVVKNSDGEVVDKKFISIYVDNTKLEHGILESINDVGKKIVIFKFDDKNTGDVFSKLEIDFVEKKASLIKGESSAELFFILDSNKKDCSISINHVSVLMKQISDASKYSDGRYSYLIACSLRTIFELSGFALKKEIPKIFTHSVSIELPKLTNQVVQVIHFLSNNNKVLERVATVLGVSFKNLKVMLDVSEFREAVDFSNVGAHSGALHLTNQKVQDMAKLSGYYAAFCDVLINHGDDSLIDSAKIYSIDL